MNKRKIASALSEVTGYRAKDFDVDGLLKCCNVKCRDVKSVYVSNGKYIRMVVVSPSPYRIYEDICTCSSGDLLHVRNFLK